MVDCALRVISLVADFSIVSEIHDNADLVLKKSRFRL